MPILLASGPRTPPILPDEPPASMQALALSSWGVDKSPDGQIVVNGSTVHPVVARDLWMRLGALLDGLDRESDHEEWTRLAGSLDRHFAGCYPVRAHTLGEPSFPVDALLLRERDGHVVLRVATFSLAILRRKGKAWEGPVYALRPTMTGHDRRPTGQHVRLADEAVAAPPAPVLAGPAPVPAPPPPAKPPRAPAQPEWLDARWASARDQLKAILALFPSPGTNLTFEDLARQMRIPREVLRGHLEALVDRRELAELPGDSPTWSRLERTDRPTFSGKPVTRFGRGPKKSKQAKIVSAKRSRTRPGPPPAPAPAAVFRCEPCNRTVQIPAGVSVPASPQCKVCRKPLTRWSNSSTRSTP